MKKIYWLLVQGGVLAILVTFLGGPTVRRVSAPRAEEPSTRQKVQKLISDLKDSSYFPDRFRAADELGKLGPAAVDAIPALADATKEREHVVIRIVAARALGKVGTDSPVALNALKTAVNDKNIHVRLTAEEAIENIFAGSGAVTPARFQVLAVAVKDAEVVVRLAAVRRVGNIGVLSREVIEVLKEATKDSQAKVVGAAVASLENNFKRLGTGNRESLPDLISAMKDDNAHVRLFATRAVGRVGSFSAETIAILKSAANDKNEDVSKAGIDALQSLFVALGTDDRSALPLLLVSLQDSEPFVRKMAANAIGKAAPFTEDVLSSLKTALKDPDAEVKRSAATSLRILFGGLVLEQAKSPCSGMEKR